MNLPDIALTKRQLEVLQRMRDNFANEDGELVYESGSGYLGLERVSGRTVNNLLRACAIRADGVPGALERYRINQTGREILDNAARPPRFARIAESVKL